MASRAEHALLYDADCGFCTRALDAVMRWDRRGRLRAVPIQSAEGDRLLASVPPAQRLDSWHLVEPSGAVHSAGAAGPPLLRLLPGGRPAAALLAALPGPTEAAYRWIAGHRELLGRFLALAVAVAVVGCGSSVQAGSELTVYLSAPAAGEQGRAIAAGAARALQEAGSQAAGAEVRLEVLDGAGAERPTQAGVAANARSASEDSSAIAYIGEPSSAATMVSAPITNEAGILQVSPGPVERELLAEPGGGDVPSGVQPTGERTLGALLPEGTELDPTRAEALGFEAMALVLDSIERADDPLSRSSVADAFYSTSGRSSELGTYTIDPVGRAAYAGPGPAEG